MSSLQDNGEVVPRWLYDQLCGLLAELVVRVQQLQHELARSSAIVDHVDSDGASSTLIGSPSVDAAREPEGEQDQIAPPQTKQG